MLLQQLRKFVLIITALTTAPSLAYAESREICHPNVVEGDLLVSRQRLPGGFTFAGGQNVALFAHCETSQQIRVTLSAAAARGSERFELRTVGRYFNERVRGTEVFKYEDLASGLPANYQGKYQPISSALCRCLNEES